MGMFSKWRLFTRNAFLKCGSGHMPVGCVQLMCSSPALTSILYCGGDIWQAFCFEAQPNHVIALQVIDCSLESHWKSFQFPVELYLTVWLRRIFLFVFLYFFFWFLGHKMNHSPQNWRTRAPNRIRCWQWVTVWQSECPSIFHHLSTYHLFAFWIGL